MANAQQRENELQQLIQIFREPKSVLSTEGPTESQNKKNDDLMEYLKTVDEFNGIETADLEKNRIIKDFEILVQGWMQEVNKKRDQTGQARVVLYGSKASKTSLKSDDIDLLIVTPPYVDRHEDFFGQLFQTLQANPKTSCLLPITRAIVPIIKCDFEDYRLDIGFVTVDFEPSKVDPAFDEMLHNDHLLASMDENMIKSYNAFRNAHLVIKSLETCPGENLLPADVRLQNYRITLLCIKLWAKKIGIYGSMLGYFGGISLAIMVAKICQLYPNMCPSMLIDRFFFIYQIFPWNEIPLLVEPLKNSSDLDFLAKGKGAFRKEDVSLNKSNKRMMYVISPAFPQMNTTYNVSDSQLKIIEDHLTEAFKTVRLIALGELDWDDLFLSYPFFHDFDSFLEIEVLSKDEASFYKWKGLIQARLRYLLLNFEQEIEEKVTFQLWPQEFNVFLVAQPEYKYACYYYIGLKSFSYQMEILSLTNIMKQWKKSVYEQWDGESRDNQVYFFSRKRNDLDTFVYTPQPKGFIKFEGTREIFPQEKEPGNLLSKLISDNGMYGQQGLSFMLGSLPSASPQLPQLLSFPQFSQPQQTSNEYFTGEQTSASKSLPGPN